MFRISIICAALVVAAWCLAPPAQAYLDPGTGNALLQGIIGGLAVAGGFVAYQWRRVRSLFASRSTAEAHEEHSNE